MEAFAERLGAKAIEEVIAHKGDVVDRIYRRRVVERAAPSAVDLRILHRRVDALLEIERRLKALFEAGDEGLEWEVVSALGTRHLKAPPFSVA